LPIKGEALENVGFPAGVSADRMSALRAESPLHVGEWFGFSTLSRAEA
jgi:hypothetical protein